MTAVDSVVDFAVRVPFLAAVDAGAFAVVALFGRAFVVLADFPTTDASSLSLGPPSRSEACVVFGSRVVAEGVTVAEAAAFGIRLRVVDRSRVVVELLVVAVVVRLPRVVVAVLLDKGLSVTNVSIGEGRS